MIETFLKELSLICRIKGGIEMKKVFLTAFLTSLIFIGFGIVQDSSNLFGVDLYKVLSEKPGNIFFSPFSISSALAMTYIGADSDTAQQMKNVLHFDLDDETLLSNFSQLTTSLNQSNENYQLSVANSMWLQEGYPFLKEFVEQIQKYYQSWINYVDFANHKDEAREKINEWIEAKTNNKIRDLIKPDDIDSLTRLVLTNAIYFKGLWLNPFDPSSTRKELFHISKNEEKEVDMMFKNITANYTEDSLVQVLELPYAKNKISMIIVLPKEDKDLSQIEKNISLDLFKKWRSNLKPTEVNVHIPKFKTECRFNLKRTLMSMGIVDAFTDEADFSKMDGTKMLKIKDVIHQSFIEVYEEGTQAAAATATIVNIKMAPKKPVEFRADRPFIFFIYDSTYDLILFMGRLINP
ncbi:MAG TPA: serpin family protein [Pseudothermotoga sp.]|jgi:serpin B|nr:serpin family protein [Pseudothermotoga sp.]